MRKLFALISIFSIISTFGCGGGTKSTVVVPTPPSVVTPPPSTASPDVRADYLVGQMTLDEKLSMIHGGAVTDWWNHTLPHGAVGWNPAITRLGIPDLYVTNINATADAAVAQETAEQGSVLLKNDGTLPLNSAAVKSIAVIGSHADIGVLSGGGSAQVTRLRVRPRRFRLGTSMPSLSHCETNTMARRMRCVMSSMRACGTVPACTAALRLEPK